jgi:hypothetical protein
MQMSPLGQSGFTNSCPSRTTYEGSFQTISLELDVDKILGILKETLPEIHRYGSRVKSDVFN